MAHIKCGHCKTYHASRYEVYLCARNAYTSNRHKQTVVANAATNLLTPPPNLGLKVPLSMVETIREGRYAVDVGTTGQRYVFIRVSRPTKGKLAGCFRIQTQHSDYFKLAIVRYPSGQWRHYMMRHHLADLDRVLTIVAVNPIDAAILYAQEMGCCSRCGRKLTDERSRYYSIGPECEKHWPDLINFINNSKGEYVG